MKLQQLPIGARFEYQGKVFVKTGPITAAGETGGNALIPKYAVLKPLDPMPAPADDRPRRSLAESTVLEAFESFYARSLRLVDESGRLELARARQAFLSALK